MPQLEECTIEASHPSLGRVSPVPGPGSGQLGPGDHGDTVSWAPCVGDHNRDRHRQLQLLSPIWPEESSNAR